MIQFKIKIIFEKKVKKNFNLNEITPITFCSCGKKWMLTYNQLNARLEKGSKRFCFKTL